MEAYTGCQYDDRITALIDCKWLTGDGGCIRDDGECGYDEKKAGKDCVHEAKCKCKGCGEGHEGELCDFYVLNRCFAHRGFALENIRGACKAFFEREEDSIVFNFGGWRCVDDIIKDVLAFSDREKTKTKAEEA